MEFVVAALYKFVTLNDPHELRAHLLKKCKALGARGTLLLAREGINGTIAGSRETVDALLACLKEDERFADIDHKEAYFSEQPFYRMKVKVKKEIVTLGIDGIDPNDTVGNYVEPGDWNALISDPEVVLVDTRNHYEYEVGTFAGAIDPVTDSFREFPDYVKKNMDPAKQKKVAMFCTGGIRCEKASAYMLKQGFQEVYHLKGGILKYLEVVPQAESLWKNDCFVFDNRVAVNHQLKKGDFCMCHGCRFPVSPDDRKSVNYQKGICCPRCHDKLTAEQKSGFAERQKQVELAQKRNKQHIGY